MGRLIPRGTNIFYQSFGNFPDAPTFLWSDVSFELPWCVSTASFGPRHWCCPRVRAAVLLTRRCRSAVLAAGWSAGWLADVVPAGFHFLGHVADAFALNGFLGRGSSRTLPSSPTTEPGDPEFSRSHSLAHHSW